MKNKIAVYTVLVGKYDDLKTPMYYDLLKNEADFFCITDRVINSSVYKIIPIDNFMDTPVKTSRFPKINSHLYFKEYHSSIYVDASYLIKCKSFSSLGSLNEDNLDILRFKHYRRNCVYQEADEIVSLNIDIKDVVLKQVNRYKKEKMPEEFGLGENGFLFRKNTESVKKFNELWWSEYVKHSKRDQLSFEFVRWKQNFKVKHLDQNYSKNDFVIYFEHNVKREVKPLMQNSFFVKTKDFIKSLVK